MRALFKQVEREHGAEREKESYTESDTITEQDTQHYAHATVRSQTASRNVRENKPLFMPVLGATATILALNMATYAACNMIRLYFLPGQTGLTAQTFEEAYRWIEPSQRGAWVITMILTVAAVSHLPPRVARWGVGIANLLYYLAVTTEYSLTASPIWVLSRSQLTGWGYAVLGAVTISFGGTGHGCRATRPLAHPPEVAGDFDIRSVFSVSRGDARPVGASRHEGGASCFVF